MSVLAAAARPDRPRLVTVEEAMYALGISRPHLYRMVQERKLRTVLIEGGRLTERVEFHDSSSTEAVENARAYKRESAERRLHHRTDYKFISACIVERWEGGRLVERAEFHDSYNMTARNNASAYFSEQTDRDADEQRRREAEKGN